jgi:excisionase family DNA binding protein
VGVERESQSWRIGAISDGEATDTAPSILDMTQSLLTAEQVARVLGVPRSWVYEQSRAGRIPTVRLGRYRRYRREAIEAWLEELEAEQVNGTRRRRAA